MYQSLLETESRIYRCEGITWLRGIACLYVVSCHLFPWYSYAAGLNSILGDIIGTIGRITQPIGETNAGVIFFIVLSGYCIHRSKGLTDLTKDDIILFYKKRVARILPVLGGGIFIGIILYLLSFDSQTTCNLTATNEISFKYILVRLGGINVFIPWGYEKTYLGNAPLATVFAELFLYFLYPLILFLDKKMCKRWKVGYVFLWGGVFLFVLLENDFRTWWENISIFCFFPYWYIGALSNKKVKDGFQCTKFLALYALLFIPFKLDITFSILCIISEVRKIIFAFFCGNMICLIDTKMKTIVFPTFGVMDIGKISFSLYVIHGPVLIWLLGKEIDIITILFIMLIVSIIFFYIFEKEFADKIYQRLVGN